MGHYCSENYKELPAKPMIEMPKSAVTNIPSHTSNNNHIGYTQVWEGKPTEFVAIIKQWSFLREDYLRVELATNPSNIVLWVANEFIDWTHLRIIKEYRPASTNSLRDYQINDGIGSERTTKPDNWASDHRQG